MGHRTGIGTIFNNTSIPWRVVHLVANTSRDIAPGQSRTFNCSEVYEWVSDDTELVGRSVEFRTQADGVLRFYMFQTYQTSTIEYVTMPGGTFSTRASTGLTYAGCVGARIMPSGTSGIPAAFLIF